MQFKKGWMIMLYERDYNSGLTPDEEKEYKEITGREFSVKPKSGFGTVNNPAKYPKAARMCKTLFPNYFLDFVDLYDTEKISKCNENYNSKLSQFNNERDILNYIKETKSYHIIASILRGLSFPTGHHGTFLFPEFQLGNQYQADYLLLAKSSGGYEFFFIEMESPCGKITLHDGQLGHEFRDGISQLDEWKRWLQANYSSFTDTMKKYKNPNLDMPDEFYTLDLSRLHYIVVAGRRKDFNNLTYTIRREYKQDKDIHILHYDNLYDYSNLLLGVNTY